MLQAILYQLYNTGSSLAAWYYLPNSTGNGWIKNPNANYTNYADKAVAYEQSVRNGSPPWSASTAEINMTAADLARAARQKKLAQDPERGFNPFTATKRLP